MDRGAWRDRVHGVAKESYTTERLSTGHTAGLGASLLSDHKESTCNAGDVEDLGSIPGLEGPLEQCMATHSSILAWTIPWTGSLVGYNP